MVTIELWDKVPGRCDEKPVLEYYPAKNKKSDAAVVILPGGGYCMRAQHEGKAFAEFINSLGMDAFVCQYRVAPHSFPLPLLDARRAVRYVRANADRFCVNKEKIAVMGSSAGGHLAALNSTYTGPIEFEDIDEIDRISALPDASILCYPVICSPDSGVAHLGSFINFVGSDDSEKAALFSCDKLVNETTPTAFIWHTSDDDVVNVANSLRYGEALRRYGKQFEMHIFPSGKHGLGLAADLPYVSRWTGMLEAWFKNINWL